MHFLTENHNWESSVLFKSPIIYLSAGIAIGMILNLLAGGYAYKPKKKGAKKWIV